MTSPSSNSSSPNKFSTTPGNSPAKALVSPKKISLDFDRRLSGSPHRSPGSPSVKQRSPKSPVTITITGPLDGSHAAKVTASPELKPVARELPVECAYVLGSNYFEGKSGLPQDFNEAYKYLKHAASLGSAQYLLGALHANGLGCAENLALAIDHYRTAAENGESKALCELGVSHFTGKGVPKDLALAAKYFLEAAEQGDMLAQFNLADCFKYGSGVEIHPSKAADWYHKAALQGDAEAQYEYAVCLGNGLGVDANHRLAFEWMLQAAHQGHMEAQYAVAEMYRCGGEGAAVKMDGGGAFTWYLAAAKQGHANAQCYLGFMYIVAVDAESNVVEAANWFKAAAKQGNVKAQYAYGVCLFDGVGVKQDPDQGREVIAEAAAAKYSLAQEWLASNPV